MLNPFWFSKKRTTETKYLFINDTTGTVPDIYRYTHGNVCATRFGVALKDTIIDVSDDCVPVDISNCTIDYTINCMSLSNINISVGGLQMYPTDSGQLYVNGKVYCEPSTVSANTNVRITYTADSQNFFVFLDNQKVGGPEPITTRTNFANVYMAASNVYIPAFSISTPANRVFDMNVYASATITKRLITPYDTGDGASYDPDGFRLGFPSTLQKTSWTGWMNLNTYTDITMASPDGYMMCVVGTRIDDETQQQIVGRTGDSPVPTTFSLTNRSSNTMVPVSIYANAYSGLTVKLTGLVPVTLGKLHPVQFPERFKILPTFRINDVDILMQITDDSRLQDVSSGLYLSSYPTLRLDAVGAKWTFTRDTITSDDGFSLASGYNFA